MTFPLWTTGAIIWGDKTLQATASADDPNPHTNPQPADLDWNTIANDYNNHVHDGVGTPLIPALYTNATPQTLAIDPWAIADVGGNPQLRISNLSPQVQVQNDLGVLKGISGGNANPSNTAGLNLAFPVGVAGTYTFVNASGTVTFTANGQTIRGMALAGTVTPNTGGSGHTFRGMAFTPFYTDAGSWTEVTSIYAAGQGVHAASGIVTERTFLKTGGENLSGAVNITTLRGLWLNNWNSTAGVYGTVVGVDVDKILAGTTRYLMRLTGPTTSNMRVDGTDPINLGSATNAQAAVLVAFNENGTVTLRTAQWKQQSTLAAADKVMIVV